MIRVFHLTHLLHLLLATAEILPPPLPLTAVALRRISAGADNTNTTGNSSATETAAAARSLRIGGSSTVLPVAEAWATVIGANYTSIVVHSGGSSSGARRVCLPDGHPDKVDIGDMSRDWRSSEALRLDDEYTFECSESGVRVTQIVIGIDGLAVVVGRGSVGHDCLTNPEVGGLTLAMLRWIFTSWTNDQLRNNGVNMTSTVRNDDGDGVKEWSDLHEVCAQVPINIYGAGNKSGTHDFFGEKVFCKDCFTGTSEPYEGFASCPASQFAYDAQGHWVHEMSHMNQTELHQYLGARGGRTPNCYVGSESDRDILDWVQNDHGGIGYFGYAYFSGSSALTLVRIASDRKMGIADTLDAKIEPSTFSITDGSYEVFRRELFMNVDNTKWDLSYDFMHYGFGEAGQNKVAAEAGYIAVNAALRAKMRQRIDERGNERADYRSVPPDTCADGMGLQAIAYSNVHGTAKTNYTCQPCSPGSAKEGTGAEPCKPCLPGMNASTMGLSRCEFCPVGKFADREGVFCRDCAVNSFASTPGMSSCAKCGAGTTADRAGLSSCSRCTLGKYRTEGDLGLCRQCPQGKTTNFQGAEDLESCKCQQKSYLPISGDGSCVPCPEGMKCEFGSRAANIKNLSLNGDLPEGEDAPRVKPGYFSFTDEPLSIYQCLTLSACPGNAPESCGSHSAGVACGRCWDGHVRREGDCIECGDIYKTRVLWPTIPLILGPPFIYFLYKFSQKDVEHWGKPLTGLAAMAYIILVNVQVIAVSGLIMVEFPEGAGMQWIHSLLSQTLQFESFLRPGCAIDNSASTTFLTRLMLPVATAMLFVFTYMFMRYMPKLPCLNFWILVNCYGSVFNTFYITIAAASLGLFQCYPHPNGKSSVRDAPEILCYEGTWNSLVGIAVTGLMLFCLTPIVVIAYVIRIMPRYFEKYSNFRLSIKFIARKFCPQEAWWTIVLLLKGVWINLATVFFTQGAGQILWLNIGLLMYAVGTVLFMPWRHYIVSLTDIASHCMLTYIFTVQAFFTSTTDDLKRNMAIAAVVIIGSDFLALLCGAAYLGYRFFVPLTEEFIRHRALMLANSFGAFSQQPDRAASLVALLPGREVRALVTASKIIRRESDDSGIIVARFSAQADKFDAHHETFTPRPSHRTSSTDSGPIRMISEAGSLGHAPGTPGGGGDSLSLYGVDTRPVPLSPRKTLKNILSRRSAGDQEPSDTSFSNQELQELPPEIPSDSDVDDSDAEEPANNDIAPTVLQDSNGLGATGRSVRVVSV